MVGARGRVGIVVAHEDELRTVGSEIEVVARCQRNRRGVEIARGQIGHLATCRVNQKNVIALVSEPAVPLAEQQPIDGPRLALAQLILRPVLDLVFALRNDPRPDDQLAAVGRPLGFVDIGIGGGQLPGFATVDPNHEDVFGSVSVRDEGNALTVGRPPR